MLIVSPPCLWRQVSICYLTEMENLERHNVIVFRPEKIIKILEFQVLHQLLQSIECHNKQNYLNSLGLRMKQGKRIKSNLELWTQPSFWDKVEPFLDFSKTQIISVYLISLLPEPSLHLFHPKNEPQLKSSFDQVIMLYTWHLKHRRYNQVYIYKLNNWVRNGIPSYSNANTSNRCT